jgi:hypothetical protein
MPGFALYKPLDKGIVRRVLVRNCDCVMVYDSI